MIESRIQTKVSPASVWQAWHKAHGMGEGFAVGKKGSSKTGFRYRVVELTPGKSFSILWKSLFVRLIFTHSVAPRGSGAEIIYSVAIKGFFAWPARLLLKEKIRRNLLLVLQAQVKELEDLVQ